MAFFERIFVIVLFFLSMQVGIALTRPDEAEIDPGAVSAPVHMLDTAIEAVVDGYGVLLILLRWRRVTDAIWAVWPLLGLAALAALSAAWSDQPILTLRRSALLFLSTFLAIYLGERYSLPEQMQLLANTFCLMILAILILRIAAPSYVVDYVSHPGAWKGLSAYKNAFGQYMAIAVALLSLVRFCQFDWLRYAFLIAATGMLLLSQSAASVFCCVLVVAVMPLWRWARVTEKQQLPIYTMATIVLVAGMYFMTTHTWVVLNLLGRNSTLTGRTQLWASVWGAIMKRPILGYGYDTFWASMRGEALDVRIGAGWLAQRADNGFLDLGLSLGALGMSLFVFVFALSFRRSIDYLKSEPHATGLWPITYLCIFLVQNMSESTLLTRGTFPLLVFVMITTSLALNGSRAEIANVTPDIQQSESKLVPYAL